MWVFGCTYCALYDSVLYTVLYLVHHSADRALSFFCRLSRAKDGAIYDDMWVYFPFYIVTYSLIKNCGSVLTRQLLRLLVTCVLRDYVTAFFLGASKACFLTTTLSVHSACIVQKTQLHCRHSSEKPQEFHRMFCKVALELQKFTAFTLVKKYTFYQQLLQYCRWDLFAKILKT